MFGFSFYFVWWPLPFFRWACLFGFTCLVAFTFLLGGLVCLVFTCLMAFTCFQVGLFVWFLPDGLYLTSRWACLVVCSLGFVCPPFTLLNLSSPMLLGGPGRPCHCAFLSSSRCLWPLWPCAWITGPQVPGTCHLSPGPGTWAAGPWVSDSRSAGPSSPPAPGRGGPVPLLHSHGFFLEWWVCPRQISLPGDHFVRLLGRPPV